MILHGIDRVTLSVPDLDRAVGFYTEHLEFQPVGRGALDTALYGWPGVRGGEAVWLSNGRQETLLELVRFDPTPTRHLRAGASTWDHGLFDIALAVRDLDPLYARLGAMGLKSISEPITYHATFAQVTAKDVLIEEPHGTYLSLIERLDPPASPPLAGAVGAILDIAQFVPDMDAALAFYIGRLGFALRHRELVPAGLIDGLLGLPAGARIALSFLHKPGETAPLIELLCCTAPGVPMRDRVPLPAIGEIAMAVEIDDLGAALPGLTVLGGPAVRTIAGRRIRSALVDAPGGVLLELFDAA